MATYGDKLEPGIISSIDSNTTVDTAGASPSDVGLVGQADLDNGSANAAEVYEVERASEARDLFGSEDESLLTAGIIDALIEGAYPVYAVATSSTSVSDEDLSGLSDTSGTLDEGPASEVADDTTFTIDGTEKTTVITYDDPSTLTPDSGDVYLNPVTGEFELDVAPADTDDTNDTVEYEYHDYSAAIGVMESGAGEEIDFLCALNEEASIAQEVVDTVHDMDDDYELSLALVGPGDTIIDPGNYSHSYDSSRVQVVYGTRFEDGTSLLAAYAGQRAALGLTRAPIKHRMETDKRIYDAQADDLHRSDRGDLIDAGVVPIADRSGGPEIIDDVNTVTDSNDDEANIEFGFTRLLIDYVTVVAAENERPFLGRFNNAGVRNAFRDLVKDELDALHSSGQVESFGLQVRQVDSDSAVLELSVTPNGPLRFITNEIGVGA